MKPFKEITTSFTKQWNFARSETWEIFNSLDDNQLQFKPEGNLKWQPLYFQFACIGRTQLVYAKAIREGKMDYSWFEGEDMPSKNDYQTKEQLGKFLKRTDKEWIDEIRLRSQEEDFKIAWPGFNQLLINHITSLIAHERLHHGQLISYFTLAGFELTKKFKDNWAL